jgi:DNA helicase-2/ATP-dependent DNA helicase PcrA
MGLEDLKICEKRQALIDSSRHLLVLGGPGCGKTTIALVKAATILSGETIRSVQKVLFLSFARATIGRVLEDVKCRVPEPQHRRLEISTYHGFEWRIIQSFGYLVTGHKRVRLLSPPDESSRMAGVPSANRREKLHELLETEQLLGFDLFPQLAADILERSPRLRRIISDSYPTIFVDEFQDTSRDEWRLIRSLAERSTVIALADPDQRIYEFRGADAARIGEFTEAVNPEIFDFAGENNRSDGTDIPIFGNGLLTRNNIGKTYTNVKTLKYPFNKAEPCIRLKFAILV